MLNGPGGWVRDHASERLPGDAVPPPTVADGGHDGLDPTEQLEAIADVLSHDLGNYLTVASGYLDLARETGVEAHLDEVEGAIGRIDELCSELVTLARTGELVEETALVELRTVVERAWAAVPTGEASLDVRDSVRLRADRAAMQHLLENVIHNAVVHAGPEVVVRVGVTDDGFSIEDDGPGIPEARRERVFESGHRTGSAGTGLGLTIAERVAAAHGWTMRVEDAADGGARFVVEGITEA